MRQLHVLAALLLVLACGDDSGGLDAAGLDASGLDGSMSDTGGSDAPTGDSASDATSSDATSIDAPGTDAGLLDARVDSGPSVGDFRAHTHGYASVLRGHACFGCDWTAYLATAPTHEVCYVTNTNTSGAGSFEGCVDRNTASNLLFVVPRVSGVVEYPPLSSVAVREPGFVYVGQAAPSPGLHFRNVTWIVRASNTALMHASGWSFLDASAVGHFINVNNASRIDDIAVFNAGGSLAMDGALQMFRNVHDASFVQTMNLWAIQGDNPEGTLFGESDSDRLGMFRSVLAHFNGRGPKVNGGQNYDIYNNLIYNWENNATHIEKDAVIRANVEGNLYVYGEQTPDSGGASPVRCGSTVLAGTRVYMDGNRVVGPRDDSDQANLWQNESPAACTLDVDARVADHAEGYTVESVAPNPMARRAFAQLVLDHAGPYPADRLPWYQIAVDQIMTRIDTGSGGGAHLDSDPFDISEHPAGAFPSPAMNSCDPEVASDCRAGQPPLPIDELAGAAPHINRMFSWIADVHCAVMPAGATGC